MGYIAIDAIIGSKNICRQLRMFYSSHTLYAVMVSKINNIHYSVWKVTEYYNALTVSKT